MVSQGRILAGLAPVTNQSTSPASCPSCPMGRHNNRQSFDVNRLTAYYTYQVRSAHRKCIGLGGTAGKRCTTRKEGQHGRQIIGVEESIIFGILYRNILLLLRLGHLVVFLPAVAGDGTWHDQHPGRQHILHQFRGHPDHHVRLRGHSGRAGRQASAGRIHRRHCRPGRAIRPIHLCAAHAYQYDAGCRAGRRGPLGWLHVRLFTD